MRFHQLITNLQEEYSIQNNGYSRKEAAGDTNDLDFFYLEDDKRKGFLGVMVNNWKRR